MILTQMTGEFAIAIQNHDSFLEDIIPPECEGSKRSYACSMLECADACLLLAEELDLESNVFTASLRGRCVCLQSVVQGDSGKFSNKTIKRFDLIMLAGLRILTNSLFHRIGIMEKSRSHVQYHHWPRSTFGTEYC